MSRQLSKTIVAETRLRLSRTMQYETTSIAGWASAQLRRKCGFDLRGVTNVCMISIYIIRSYYIHTMVLVVSETHPA